MSWLRYILPITHKYRHNRTLLEQGISKMTQQEQEALFHLLREMDVRAGKWPLRKGL